MNLHVSQEENGCCNISDMVKKRNFFVKSNADMHACLLRREKRWVKSNSIVPFIAETTIVYKNNMLPTRFIYYINVFI